MPPRSSSPICERSLDLTLIGIGRRDIPQCSSKHFHMEAFYQTFQAVRDLAACSVPDPALCGPPPGAGRQAGPANGVGNTESGHGQARRGWYVHPRARVGGPAVLLGWVWEWMGFLAGNE